MSLWVTEFCLYLPQHTHPTLAHHGHVVQVTWNGRSNRVFLYRGETREACCLRHSYLFGKLTNIQEKEAAPSLFGNSVRGFSLHCCCSSWLTMFSSPTMCGPLVIGGCNSQQVSLASVMPDSQRCSFPISLLGFKTLPWCSIVMFCFLL